MKKNILLIMFIVCILISGCSKEWEKYIQISDLKVEDDYIIGKIKNISQNQLDITLEVELSSGSLQENKQCYIDIAPNETKDISCIAIGEYKDYKVTVKNVKIKKKKTLEEMNFKDNQEITYDELETYFEDIFNNHLDFATSLFLNIDNAPKYPYAKTITYYDDKIEIENILSDPYISVIESFDKESGEANSFFIATESDNTNLIDSVKKRLLINPYLKIEISSIFSSAMENETEAGKCYQFGGYCYSYTTNDVIAVISISKQ